MRWEEHPGSDAFNHVAGFGVPQSAKVFAYGHLVGSGHWQAQLFKDVR
jgi:hypothetical protein